MHPTKFTAFLALALLGACSSDKSDDVVDANTISFNNFEGGGGWSNDPYRNDPTLMDKGRAHSGQYAIKVDKDHEYSLTYDMALGQISPKKFKTLHVEAWVFMPSSKATGVLAVQVVDHAANKQLSGDNISFKESVKDVNKWVQVSKDIVMPDNIAPTQHLRVFLYRADATDVVLVDDVKLSIKD